MFFVFIKSCTNINITTIIAHWLTSAPYGAVVRIPGKVIFRIVVSDFF